jgi:hypothetical protein
MQPDKEFLVVFTIDNGGERQRQLNVWATDPDLDFDSAKNRIANMYALMPLANRYERVSIKSITKIG